MALIRFRPGGGVNPLDLRPGQDPGPAGDLKQFSDPLPLDAYTSIYHLLHPWPYKLSGVPNWFNIINFMP